MIIKRQDAKITKNAKIIYWFTAEAQRFFGNYELRTKSHASRFTFHVSPQTRPGREGEEVGQPFLLLLAQGVALPGE